MKIDRFREEYSFLSNMFETNIEFEGKSCTSSESIYQSFKTLIPEEQVMIRKTKPSASKQYWKYAPIRNPDFHAKKLEYMELALRAKFSNPFLRNLLRKTGSAELLEGNWWGDTFWGVDQDSLEGQNHLGKLLMKLRDEIHEERKNMVRRRNTEEDTSK